MLVLQLLYLRIGLVPFEEPVYGTRPIERQEVKTRRPALFLPSRSWCGCLRTLKASGVAAGMAGGRGAACITSSSGGRGGARELDARNARSWSWTRRISLRVLASVSPSVMVASEKPSRGAGTGAAGATRSVSSGANAGLTGRTGEGGRNRGREASESPPVLFRPVLAVSPSAV